VNVKGESENGNALCFPGDETNRAQAVSWPPCDLLEHRLQQAEASRAASVQVVDTPRHLQRQKIHCRAHKSLSHRASW
jgi:hypothetical protein